MATPTTNTQAMAKMFVEQLEAKPVLSSFRGCYYKPVDISWIHKLWLRITRQEPPMEYVRPKLQPTTTDTVTFKRPADDG